MATLNIQHFGLQTPGSFVTLVWIFHFLQNCNCLQTQTNSSQYPSVIGPDVNGKVVSVSVEKMVFQALYLKSS